MPCKGVLFEGLSPKTHFPAPVLGQVHPSGVHLFDQCDLLLSAPTLELFFAADGSHHVLIALVVHEPVHFVFFGEALEGIYFVLKDTGANIAGHTDIKRAGAAGKDVNPELVIRTVTHGERW